MRGMGRVSWQGESLGIAPCPHFYEEHSLLPTILPQYLWEFAGLWNLEVLFATGAPRYYPSPHVNEQGVLNQTSWGFLFYFLLSKY